MIPDFDAAMFDLDGTLLSTMRYWRLTTLEYLLNRGVIPNAEELGRLFYESGRGLLAELIEKYQLPCDWSEVFHATEGYMLRHYREDARPKPGAEEYLRALRRRGAKLCVGTASLKEFVEEALERTGLLPYFEFVTDNRELAMEKSDPAFFRAVAERLGVPVERMCVFEDAAYAIRGAKEAGCPVIGILDPTQLSMREEIIALADCAVADYRELLDAMGDAEANKF